MRGPPRRLGALRSSSEGNFVSKTAPQRGRHTVARHGALKSPHPFSVFMKALGIVVAVVLVSGTGVAAYTVYDLAASYATENTVELE